MNKHQEKKVSGQWSVVSGARSAFTFIEMLVVVGVTAMLAGIVILNSQASRQQLTLMTEKARLTQLILRSKSLAISTMADGLPGELPCGYGLYVNYPSSTYSLFSYTVDECDGIAFIDATDPLAFEIVPNSTFALDKDINFRTPPDPFIPPTNTPAAFILFIPPNPKVLLAKEDGTVVTDGSVYIYLKAQQGEYANISVNQQGQVVF